jgi:hypothetical protein
LYSNKKIVQCNTISYGNIRIMKGQYIIFIKLILLFFIATSLEAKSKDTAFHTFNMGSNWVINTNRNTFHQYWQPHSGIEIYVKSPFYYGNTQIGLQYVPFSGKLIQQTSFNSLYLYINWEKEWNPYRSFYCSLGGRLGFYQMYFERDFQNIHSELTHEQEFAAGLCSSLSYSLPVKWRITVTGMVLKIYTYKRIHLTIFSMGLCKEFNTPQWLQEFLK